MKSIFTRDHPGTADEATINAFADAILALDDSVPRATYVDMCSKLPGRSRKIPVPTLVMPAEYDGIAGFDDLMEFYKRLPNADKQFSVMAGISHASFQQKITSWPTTSARLLYASGPVVTADEQDSFFLLFLSTLARRSLPFQAGTMWCPFRLAASRYAARMLAPQLSAQFGRSSSSRTGPAPQHESARISSPSRRPTATT